MTSHIERLECVYYPGPLPADDAVLTVLCLVFDRVYFPGVYLPKGDYDKQLLRTEIERLENLNLTDYDTHELIRTLKFLEHRLPLDGMLEYPTPRDNISSSSGSKEEEQRRSKLAHLVYDVHFPPRKNFIPTFTPSNFKGLPGGDEEIIYAGDFYYQAWAIAYAADHNLPLLDDGSGLKLPFKAQYKDDAKALSTLLALETVAFGLPDLPPMTVQELVNFRMENTSELQSFRACMLRYAKSLNELISESTPIEEVNKKAEFIIDTEIHPALFDLHRDLTNPNRPWARRMADFGKVVASIGLGYLSGGVLGQTLASGVRDLAAAELDAKAEKQAKAHGLHYLVKARTIGR